MDFDLAAQRLQRDHSQLRTRNQARRTQANQRQATARRVAERDRALALERQRVAQRKLRIRKAYQQGERSQRVHTLLGTAQPHPLSSLESNNDNGVASSSSPSPSLQLIPTSIHGDGDKVALPPSVLEVLTATMSQDAPSALSQGKQQPWMFRIGMLNPDYAFPMSPLMKALGDEEGMEIDDEGDEDMVADDRDERIAAAYLDELDHRYLSYTHGTVVEFTQAEGHIGLPRGVAAALLRHGDVKTRRTVDPSVATEDSTMPEHHTVDDPDDQTPGHVAWGAFDVPDTAIEVVRVSLPLGRTTRLRPTVDSVQRGLFNLPNLKLVLEQSLMRTRATLTIGDDVPVWHRGKSFGFVVAAVEPAEHRAVSCIQTDLEIEFDSIEESPSEQDATMTSVENKTEPTPSLSGRRLNESNTLPKSSETAPSSPAEPSVSLDELTPEPPPDQSENVVTVQIRAPSGKGQRRFDVDSATVRDLYAFGRTIQASGGFVLSTRFPRRVFVDEEGSGNGILPSLRENGLTPGQELIMLEPIE